MDKPGRNKPCPCGSGKKFKKCCLEKGLQKKEETRDPVTIKIKIKDPFPDNKATCFICKFHAHYIQCSHCEKTFSKEYGDLIPRCGPIYCKKHNKMILYKDSSNIASNCEYYKKISPFETIFNIVIKREVAEEISKILPSKICKDCIKNSMELYEPDM